MRKMCSKQLHRFSSLCVICVFLGAFALGFMFYEGILLFNNPNKTIYPVRGVDVSAYQGEIDWQVLASQDISFAFMKATEGSSFVDPCFAYNWEHASKTDLRIGAYHFFSFESRGSTQAENFIRTVEKLEGMLPPVIDLELYGSFIDSPPERQKVQTQLDEMLLFLEEHYGCKPIIYATEETYDLYLREAYSEYDIWFRDVVSQPSVSDGKQWTFWQYTNREKLKGYSGEERFIDMNVFYGTEEEFAKYN